MKIVKIAQRGFTLIELLIVIALLGALAIGLIGALDPLEQFNKGEDAVMQDVISQYRSAAIRYRAGTGAWPWASAAVGNGTDTGVALSAGAVPGYTASIVGAGELKTTFSTNYGTKLDNIYLNYVPASDSLRVCFRPTSKAIRTNKATVFNQAGVQQPPATCPVAANNCYWCIIE